MTDEEQDYKIVMGALSEIVSQMVSDHGIDNTRLYLRAMTATLSKDD